MNSLILKLFGSIECSTSVVLASMQSLHGCPCNVPRSKCSPNSVAMFFITCKTNTCTMIICMQSRFRKSHLELTKKFYDKNGGKALILGRFLPIIRTFAPILAGVIKVNFKKFMVYNIVGAVAWIVLLAGSGYYLGNNEWVKNNINSIVFGFIIVTLIPLFATYLKRKRE